MQHICCQREDCALLLYRPYRAPKSTQRTTSRRRCLPHQATASALRRLQSPGLRAEVLAFVSRCHNRIAVSSAEHQCSVLAFCASAIVSAQIHRSGSCWVELVSLFKEIAAGCAGEPSADRTSTEAPLAITDGRSAQPSPEQPPASTPATKAAGKAAPDGERARAGPAAGGEGAAAPSASALAASAPAPGGWGAAFLQANATAASKAADAAKEEIEKSAPGAQPQLLTAREIAALQ